MSRAFRNLTLAAPTLLVFAALGVQHLHAYPGDVFVAGAPVQGPSIDSPTEIAQGTYSVATKTGAAQYGVPLPVPPGRRGLAPELGLSYSSQAPLRGGIAAGWSLDIPSIEVDTSRGRLADTRYRSALAGGQPLIAVDEPGAAPGAETYRARNDSSYARYERYRSDRGPGYWRVLSRDGLVMYFGETAASRDQSDPNLSDWQADEGRWFLTRVVDRHGNEVRYHYETVRGNAAGGTIQNTPVDIALTQIEYNHNPGLGLQPHARINFEYAPAFDLCAGSNVPIGARFDYRFGFRVYEGARRLDAIRVESRQSPNTPWSTRRRLELDYDTDELACTVGHAPLRLLTGVRERTWNLQGEELVSPSVTFDYGTRVRQLDTTIPLPFDQTAVSTALGSGHRRLSQLKAGGWPTVDSMWLDVDGDGGLDVLRSKNLDTCEVERRLSTGAGWTAAADAMWPSLPWRLEGASGSEPVLDELLEEGCNLGFQLSRRSNQSVCPSLPSNYTSYRIVDLDGDQVPELVTALDSKLGRYLPWEDPYLYGTEFGGAPDCPGGLLPCRNSLGEPVVCEMKPIPTALYSAPTSDTVPYGEPCLTGCMESCEFVPDPHPPTDEGGVPHNYWCTCSVDACNQDPAGIADDTARPDLDWGWAGDSYQPGDVGGQLAQKSMNPSCGYIQEQSCGQYVWRVFRWDAALGTFSDPEVRLSPIPLESDRATAPTSRELAATASSWHGIIDIDGDSCLDAVWQQPDFRDPDWSGELQVFRGDCQGGFHGDDLGEPYLWPTPPLDRRPVVSLQQTGYVTNVETNGHMHRWTQTAVTLTDINGDGLPDYVTNLPQSPEEHADIDGLLSAPLRVYFNTGAGFEAYPTVLSDWLTAVAHTRNVVMKEYGGTGHLEVGYSVDTASQLDFDSDGLVDVMQLLPPRANRTDPWTSFDASVVVGHFNVGDRLVNVGPRSAFAPFSHGLAGITVSNGQRWLEKTAIRDFNGDGLADVFSNLQHFGPQLDEVGSTGSCDPGADEGNYNESTWSGCGNSKQASTGSNDRFAAGLPLLSRVDNGRGLEVRFVYGSSADESVVETAGGRLPSPMWVVRATQVSIEPTAPGSATALPSSLLGLIGATTEYRYREPVYNADPDGVHGFRGFTEVHTTGPANAGGDRAISLERFAFDLDHSGRKVAAEVRDAAGALHSLEETDWTERSLFQGAVRTYHVAEIRGWTCAADSGAATDPTAACKGAGHLLRSVNTWRPLTLASSPADLVTTEPPDTHDSGFGGGSSLPSGSTLMFVLGASRTTESAGEVVPGDRGATTAYRLHHGPDLYHLLEAEVGRYEALTFGSDGQWGTTRLLSRVQVEHDDKGLPLTTRQWHTEAGEPAVTTRDFTAAGNLEWSKKPVQQATGEVSSVTYEPFQIYPATASNELDHLVHTQFDFATGQPISRQGPYQPGHGWPGEDIKYDGLGRVLSRRVTYDSGSGNYLMATVFEASYVDGAPSSVTTRTRQEYEGDEWIESTTFLDGAGRAYRTEQASAAGLAVTEYAYDDAGNVTRAEVPNPRQGATGPAVYTYTHDALGRVTRYQPPLGAAVELAYDGLTVTESELPTDDALPRSVTRTTDVFGRLRTVIEHVPDGDDAVTDYGYDGNDNMNRIVDADGIVTRMEHDLAGHRLAIHRAGRTWRYDYDLNGNLIAEMAPHDGTFASDPQYTTTTDYDALDRPLSRSTPPAGVADKDLVRYAVGLTEFHYDQTGHANGLGRLTTVELPQGSGTITYEYTVEGWVSEETRTFAVSPHGSPISDERTIKRTYNAMGAPTRTIHADDPDVPSVTLAEYDDRGLPLALYLDPLPEEPDTSTGGGGLPSLEPIVVTPDGRRSYAAPTMLNSTYSMAGFDKSLTSPTAEPEPAQILLARLDRSVAGVVTRRTSDFAQAQTWSYDDLGRVRAGIIRACAGQYGLTASQSCSKSGTVIGGEHLVYTSLGNVKSVTDAATGKSIRYTYDAQQQLATAVSTPSADFAANFLYSPAGRVTEAYIAGSGPGVLPRDVIYHYPGVGATGADPAAVTALQPRDATEPETVLGGFGGTTTTEPAGPVASFTYDPRGNLLTRTVGNTEWTFIYDGDDRLREAIKRVDSTVEAREVYYYDHTNRRYLAASTATPSEPVARTRFWFAETELTYNADSTVLRQEVHANLGAMPVARITRGTADPATTGQPEVQLTYHGTLGSLLATADTDSNLTAAYRYGPFGEILNAAGPESSTHTRLFNGKELDPLTDLGYYGYRYYDRLTLTWTQADPLYRFVPDLAYGEPRRMGLYTFTLNNPLRYIDPDGLNNMALIDQADYKRQKEKEKEDARKKRQEENRSCGFSGSAPEDGGSGCRVDYGGDAGENPNVLSKEESDARWVLTIRIGSWFITPQVGLFVNLSLAHNESEVAGPIIGYGCATACTVPHQTATGGGGTLYRVVDDVELADIRSTGAFRTAPGGYETGKQFVDNLADAQRLRDRFATFFGGNQTVVKGHAPNSVLESAARTPFADISGGTAVTVPAAELPKIRPIVD